MYNINKIEKKKNIHIRQILGDSKARIRPDIYLKLFPVKSKTQERWSLTVSLHKCFIIYSFTHTNDRKLNEISKTTRFFEDKSDKSRFVWTRLEFAFFQFVSHWGGFVIP